MAEENTIRRIPPHDINAERSVIGSMLMDRDAISEVSAILIKDDFYNTQYGIIYDAMVDLYNEVLDFWEKFSQMFQRLHLQRTMRL